MTTECNFDLFNDNDIFKWFNECHGLGICVMWEQKLSVIDKSQNCMNSKMWHTPKQCILSWYKWFLLDS